MSFPSMSRIARAELVTQIAAQWVLRQERGPLSSREQRELSAWLAADAAHASSYEDAIWALNATGQYAAEPDLLAMREAALLARGERRPRILLWGGVSGAIAASVLGLWLWTASPETLSRVSPVQDTHQSLDPNHVDYATAVGERLAVILPDTSIVTLDTDSKIRVVYSRLERGVRLLRGQALFEVAHGKPQPFEVYAGSQRITAVGTMFNVRLDGNNVKVALLQGVVRVRPVTLSKALRKAPVHELVMRAGEVAELQPGGTAVARSADVTQLASWRGGDLVFNDTRLADAVAEINRYTTRPIAIADSEVGNYRISGVFRSNDPDRFSRAMSEILPVDVRHSPDGAVVLRARN